MSLPNLTLATPPFRLTRHTHALTQQPLSTTPAPSPSPSRPSTSSTNTSFNTALSTLETSSPFRYYLPHISTRTSPVYTTNASYACNTAPASYWMGIDQVGLFYQYIPGASTAERDVYANGSNAVEAAEQKVLGAFKDVVFDKPRTPGGVGRLVSLVGKDDFVHDSGNRGVGEGDVGSYSAGEKLDGRGGETKEPRKKLTKDRDRKSETMADVSKKVVRMLKKLHFGKKTSKQQN